MQMNRSDLLLRKRNAPEQRQKRGCRGSTELPIVVPRRSWREISCGKLGTLIQQTKNSLNFVSTCLKVVDTRRQGLVGDHHFVVFDVVADEHEDLFLRHVGLRSFGSLRIANERLGRISK